MVTEVLPFFFNFSVPTHNPLQIGGRQRDRVELSSRAVERQLGAPSRTLIIMEDRSEKKKKKKKVTAPTEQYHWENRIPPMCMCH